MAKFLFPWEYHVLSNYPYALLVFIIIVSIILSIVTWIRDKDHNSLN